ncbi:MAG: ribonuclease P protein component [Bacteroidales bacterium]|jgi:ribonuclease P protein component|nr:ribonuclease P protein component [Bacteroidales bacterium]
MTQTLPKTERLSGKTAVGTLMKKGRWGVSGCLKYCVLSPGGSDVDRVMVSVSKRIFKRAVRRNLLKRRMRESYRTQKDLLGQAGPLDLLLVYNSKEILDYQVIRQDVAAVLQHIAHQKEETV